MKTAILLSGGIDSSSLAYWIRPQLALTINYGQKSAAGEIRAASQIAAELGVVHEVISVDCSALGSGDLTGTIPHDAAPVTEWWPFRNQFIITVAAMRAVAVGAEKLVVGSVASDSIHVDGSHEFFHLLDRLVSMQECGLRVDTPGLQFSSLELVHRSGIPGRLLGWTHSCHKAEYTCGHCRGCAKRREVMAAVEDENHKASRT